MLPSEFQEQVNDCRLREDWISECKLFAVFKGEGHTIEEISRIVKLQRTVIGDRIALGNFPQDILEIFSGSKWALNTAVRLLPLRKFQSSQVEFTEIREFVLSFSGRRPNPSEVEREVSRRRKTRAKLEADRIIGQLVQRYGDGILEEIGPVKDLLLKDRKNLEKQIDELQRRFIEKKRASLLQQINSMTKRKSDFIAMLLLVSSQLEYMDASEVESFLYEIDHLLKIVGEVRESVEPYEHPNVIVGLVTEISQHLEEE